MMHPKEPRLESPRLLLIARNQPRPCLIGSPQCVTRGADTSCCACHGNCSVVNKAKGLKAHDFFSVWGCARCHTWLDESYIASGNERELAFWKALGRQVIEWDKIAQPLTSRPADREACAWALDQLAQRGYATRTEAGLYLPTWKH